MLRRFIASFATLLGELFADSDREMKEMQAKCDKLNDEWTREWLAAHPGWPDTGRIVFYRIR
jgi:hypothetical protein